MDLSNLVPSRPSANENIAQIEDAGWEASLCCCNKATIEGEGSIFKFLPGTIMYRHICTEMFHLLFRTSRYSADLPRTTGSKTVDKSV